MACLGHFSVDQCIEPQPRTSRPSQVDWSVEGHCTPPCPSHLRLVPPFFRSPCISPPPCLCCDVLQQWQREKRTGGSLANAVGWMWANHCWRGVSVHRRQLVGGSFSHGGTTLGPPMGGYIAPVLDSCTSIRSTHTATYTRRGLLRTDKEPQTHFHACQHVYLSHCLSKRLRLAMPCSAFSSPPAFSTWHTVDRHVRCGLLLLWKFIF